MKRRNADLGKMRRSIKRNKITEGIYGSTILYLKFLLLWVLVILADFILEFRFEFLWPFYLLLRSVYDSFKYQGLAFSVFFICIALTSDLICFFFIPVHWLFFAASTYVWVQYVWHTDKGICLPTIILWMLFVYLEAAVRLKDLRHMSSHMDLCRPFAAHCIGYPVVTLGFGFKSYIGFRMRQRKQRDVAKENEFYMQLLQQALPVETTSQNNSTQNENSQPQEKNTKVTQNQQKSEKNGIANGIISNGTPAIAQKPHRKSVEKSKEHNVTESEAKSTQQQNNRQNNSVSNNNHQSNSHSNGNAVGPGITEETVIVENDSSSTKINSQNRRKERHREEKEAKEAAEYLQRLEMDTKRLRSDLQCSRSSEQDLRAQVASLTSAEKSARVELSQLRSEHEELQQRLNTVLSTKQSDRQTISSLERRLAEERRQRSHLESQLAHERKQRKQEEAAVRAAQHQSQRQSSECTESCRNRRRELENELAEARQAARWTEERCAVAEREAQTLAEHQQDTDILMAALSAMQDKNQHLENSLSAETRIKLDLFSALGEAKRLLEIRESMIRSHEKEIEELKGKIAQVLAVMPSDSFGSGPTPSSSMSRVRLAESPVSGPPGSTLDPNATAYTPKGSLVASTEA